MQGETSTTTATAAPSIEPPFEAAPLVRQPEVLPASDQTFEELPIGTAPPARLAFSCSPRIEQLVTALAKAQLEFEDIEKDKRAVVDSRREGARSYTYNYASLSALLKVVRPVLARNGIATMQPPCVGQRSVTVTTLLCHVSGEWVRNELPVAIGGLDPQTIGSAISYMRRYALKSLLGLAEDDEDDDGAAATRSVNGNGRTVPMPSRASAAAAPGASVSAQTPCAATPPVPAAAAPVYTIKTLQKRKTSADVWFWEAVFTNGKPESSVRAVTKDGEIGGRLEHWYAQRTRIVDLVTHLKDGWTFIDEVRAQTGGQE